MLTSRIVSRRVLTTAMQMTCRRSAVVASVVPSSSSMSNFCFFSTNVTTKSTPDLVFDDVDKDHDGLITNTEFHDAIRRLDVEPHNTPQALLQKKLELVLEIEDQLVKLAETTAQKQDVVYNNIGLTTAGDLDVLFAKSHLKRDTVQSKVQQLKALIEEAKSMYSGVEQITKSE